MQLLFKPILQTAFCCFWALSWLNNIYAQPQFSDAERFFNGKDFEHWVEPDQNIWWSITAAGELLAKSDPQQIGSTLWTAETYTDFEMQLDFKMGSGTVDSGVFIRGESPENPQIQIGESGSLKRDMTASPYVPSKGYPKEAMGIKKLLKPKAWNTLIIKAVKNRTWVWLNGKAVLDFTLENANLKGPVGLQLHPNRNMDIAFRNIYFRKK